MNLPIPEDLAYHPGADQDAEEAEEWYENRSERAADEFEVALREAECAILRDPYAYLSFTKDTRRYKVSRFPFWVIYAILPDVIFVLAVAHEKREGGYWLERLENEE
ncbi:MAG: type II toxin-antitoxin system RelE/ParE family toxin [Planctomycetota bacterium]|nr:type II toxin-antitoxin system RelE/ParE family toxin [Planctomycetota bacterium]